MLLLNLFCDVYYYLCLRCCMEPVNDYITKNFVLNVTDKRPRHNTRSCPVFSNYIWFCIYVYMCVHICIMNLHVHGCGYVSSCFTCYLGFIMTASFYWSPILRFTKSHLFYSWSLPIQGWYIVRRLCYRTF